MVANNLKFIRHIGRLEENREVLPFFEPISHCESNNAFLFSEGLDSSKCFEKKNNNLYFFFHGLFQFECVINAFDYGIDDVANYRVRVPKISDNQRTALVHAGPSIAKLLSKSFSCNNNSYVFCGNSPPLLIACAEGELDTETAGFYKKKKTVYYSFGNIEKVIRYEKKLGTPFALLFFVFGKPSYNRDNIHLLILTKYIKRFYCNISYFNFYSYYESYSADDEEIIQAIFENIFTFEPNSLLRPKEFMEHLQCFLFCLKFFEIEIIHIRNMCELKYKGLKNYTTLKEMTEAYKKFIHNDTIMNVFALFSTEKKEHDKALGKYNREKIHEKYKILRDIVKDVFSAVSAVTGFGKQS